MMAWKRAWLYCRVAHNGPDSAEFLEGQRLRLESYAREHGFIIVGCSSDIGNGLTLERPGLHDFHAAAEDEEVDILLLKNLSRLGRDTSKVIEYWHQLRDLGVIVHTADCGEIDLRRNAMLRKKIDELRNRPR